MQLKIKEVKVPKKMQKRDALVGQVHERKAQVAQTQSSKDSLTFVMVSENNEGMRYDWRISDNEFIERLDISGADMSGLNTFFKNHNRGVDDAIGRIVNTRMEGTSLLCDVVFDESGLDIKRKYENKTLTDVSIGYKINKYTVEERQGEPDIVTITDFSIVELSAVGIGFDSGAKHQGRDANFNIGENEMDKELMERLAKLEKISKRSEEQEKEISQIRAKIDAQKDEELQSLRAEKVEAVRKAEILTIATQYNASEEIRAKFEKEGTSQEFMKAILDERASTQETFHASAKDDSTRENMMRAIGDAIAMKAGVNVEKPHEDANMFRGASMTDMAKQVCGIRSYDRNEIASRAMVTADFPMLLVQAGNRVLEQGYALQTSSFEKWVRQVDVQDFKINTDITLGTAGRLSKLNEAGEIKEKQLSEAGEEWKIESFANEFVLTRQMLVNDDLGAFNSLLSDFGQMAKRTANGLVYDLLQGKGDYANYKMKDGLKIFASGHNNLDSSGAVIDEASMTAARAVMMRQTAKSTKDALNILPEFLIVAPEQEITARKLIASASSLESNKNEGVINPFANSMQVVVDSELTAGAWYLAGGMRTIKAGYLAGTGRKPIVRLDQTSLTKTVFQGVFDFGVVAEDFRSLYKNVGA